MPRRITAEGRTITVPDDATDEEINQIFGPASAAAKPAPQGFLSSAAESSGLTGLTNAIAHPIDTIRGIPSAIKNAATGAANEAHDEVNAIRDNGFTQDTRRKLGSDIPVIGSTLSKAQAQHDAGNDAGMAGTLAGTVLGAIAPTAASRALKALPEGLSTLGTGIADSGVNRMNEAVGSRAADFKRGVNPARSYLEAGGGPAVSMESLADKSLALKSGVGQQIRDVRTAATANGLKIPASDVAGALNPAISKGISLETGPGGLGNVAPIENYSASFRPTLKNAIVNGGVSPIELQDLKSGIANNTNWSDPNQFSLKSIRQQNVGALSGIESAAIPEIAPLKSQFQGLTKFSDRAEARSLTHSQPLSGLVGGLGKTIGGAAVGAAAGNIPAAIGGAAVGSLGKSLALKTALATGMYRGGGLLGDAGGMIAGPASLLPSTPITPYNFFANKKSKDNNKSDNE